MPEQAEPDVERLRRVFADLAEKAKQEFTLPDDVRVTVIARTLWLPPDGGDVLVTDDVDALALAAFCRLSGMPDHAALRRFVEDVADKECRGITELPATCKCEPCRAARALGRAT